VIGPSQANLRGPKKGEGEYGLNFMGLEWTNN